MLTRYRGSSAVVTGLLVLLLFAGPSLNVAGVSVDTIKRGVESELGVDKDLCTVIDLEYKGHDLVIIAAFINERTLESDLDPEILEAMEKYVGQNAVFISAVAQTKDGNFNPNSLRFHQDGDSVGVSSVEGITEDFGQGKLPEGMNVMGDQFWGSKGIVVFDDRVNPEQPFEVEYGNARRQLSIRGSAQETTPTQEQEQQSDKQEQQSEESFSDTETGEGEVECQPGSGDGCQDASGNGSFLFVGFVNLLVLTLTALL
ncbi:MAG: hypothetical protein ACLFN4_03740 [Candidatus Acetothermia bacterium]